jgi:hypothetical protein
MEPIPAPRAHQEIEVDLRRRTDQQSPAIQLLASHPDWENRRIAATVIIHRYDTYRKTGMIKKG